MIPTIARCLLVTLCLAPALPVLAQDLTAPLVSDVEDVTYRPFYDHVAARLDGRLADGVLVVESARGAGNGALAVYALREDRPVSVFADVTVALSTPDSDGQDLISGGGIVLRRSNDGEPVSFHALLAQSEGYLVLTWMGSDITRRIAGPWPVGAQERVRLAGRETATGAEFFVDGVSVALLDDGAVTGRRAGLAVFGDGRMIFDSFGLNSLSDIGD